MGQKEIIIDKLHCGYTQKADLEPDISNSDPIKTFDGPVPADGSGISWKLTIDKLVVANTAKEYIKFETLIYKMIRTPKNIKIVEEIQLKGSSKTMLVEQIMYGATVDGKKLSMDAENLSAENLSFQGTKLRKWVDGTEIPIPEI